jgi:hypothetical protein
LSPSNRQVEKRPYCSLKKTRLHPSVKLKNDMFSRSIGSCLCARLLRDNWRELRRGVL